MAAARGPTGSAEDGREEEEEDAADEVGLDVDAKWDASAGNDELECIRCRARAVSSATDCAISAVLVLLVLLLVLAVPLLLPLLVLIDAGADGV